MVFTKKLSQIDLADVVSANATIVGVSGSSDKRFDPSDIVPAGAVTPEMFGAAADGVTDDRAAIQAAINALPSGGKVVFGPHSYAIGGQLILNADNQVLQGSGKRVSNIQLKNTFPASTAAIRIGTGASIIFDAQIRDLGIHCGQVAGSIGVYSNEMNEGCGLFGVAIVEYKDTGIFYDAGCEHFENSDLEVYATNQPSNYGIKIGNNGAGAGPVSFNRITVVGNGVGNTTACIWLNGTNGGVFFGSALHLENAADGILISGDNMAGAIAGMDAETVTNGVHFTGKSPIAILNAQTFFGEIVIRDDTTGAVVNPAYEATVPIWTRKPVWVPSSPTIVTSSPYTVLDTDTAIIANRSGGSVGLVLPNPAAFVGRQLRITNWQPQLVVSIGTDVIPIGGSTAAANILPATPGTWSELQSDSTAWKTTAISAIPTIPVFISSTSYTVDLYDYVLQNNASGTLTLTLPSPASFPARELKIFTTGQAVNSDSSNIATLSGGVTSAILSASAGKFAHLISDGGSFWRMTAAN
jgi:Pectate lyase superfamily protein